MSYGYRCLACGNTPDRHDKQAVEYVIVCNRCGRCVLHDEFSFGQGPPRWVEIEEKQSTLESAYIPPKHLCPECIEINRMHLNALLGMEGTPDAAD